MVLSYKTVKTNGEAEITEKRSRFISRVIPVATEDEAALAISEIRKAYKDASHHCVAYRVGIDIITEKHRDDGEPQGTAGMPMLEVMRKERITNAVIVVTRYFGGTLLGASGLARAYAAACAAGIAAAGVIYKDLFQNMAVTVSYGVSGALKHEIAARGIILNDTVYTDGVTFFVSHPTDAVKQMSELYMRLSAGKAVIGMLETEYVTRPSSQ